MTTAGKRSISKAAAALRLSLVHLGEMNDDDVNEFREAKLNEVGFTPLWLQIQRLAEWMDHFEDVRTA